MLIALTRSGVLVPDGSDEAETGHGAAPGRGPGRSGGRAHPDPARPGYRDLARSARRRPPGDRQDGRPAGAGPGPVRPRGRGAASGWAAASRPQLVLAASRAGWRNADHGGGRRVTRSTWWRSAAMSAVVARSPWPCVEAYADLHRHGVLHGDVHPGNILLDADRRVRLIDFGLAAVPGRPARAPPSRRGVSRPAVRRRAARGPAATGPGRRRRAVRAGGVGLPTGHRRGLSRPGMRTTRRPCGRSCRRRRDASPRSAGRWAAGERVLRRALAKDPGDRFARSKPCAEALRRAVRGLAPRRPRTRTCPASWPNSRSPERSGPKRTTPEAAHAAWLLTRVATLTGDVTAHDLAEVWACRAARAPGSTVPQADQPIVIAHRALAAYRRTGRGRHLLSA